METSKSERSDGETSDPSSSGQLLGAIAFAIYAVFTLLPNSVLQIVAWPFAPLWLGGLACGALWGLLQWWRATPARGLGLGLDGAVALSAIATIASTVTSQWPTQGSWYVAQFVLHLMVLYGLVQWLRSPLHRLWMLKATGWLGFVFSLESLTLWIGQVVLPKLNQIQRFEQLGLAAQFNFGSFELQNTLPLFHQNYVAGFLLLLLPCTVTLVWLQRQTRWRWWWALTCGLELVALWSTQSRGGWLGLLAACLAVLGIALWHWLRSWRSRAIAIACFSGGTIALAAASPRLQVTLTALASGNLHAFSFRAIAAAASWDILAAHPLLGTGPGTAAWVFSTYRPDWAGLEAQAMFHLHSTPLQLMAELGGMGLLVVAVWLAVLVGVAWRYFRQWQQLEGDGDRAWAAGLSLGLLGFGVQALTDYQLDVPAISLYLIAAIAGLASMAPPSSRSACSLGQQRAVGAIGCVALAIALTSIGPRYWAWSASSRGLEAYFDNDFATAQVQLDRAHQIFPQEPFYPVQAGWIANRQASEISDPAIQVQKRQEAIAWFERGLEILPNDEFLHTNLGYFQLAQRPALAAEHFQRSLELNPARSLLATGLGLARLGNGESTDRAIAPLVRDLVRHPHLISSPLWQQALLPETYAQLLDSLDATYAGAIDRYPQLAYLRHNWAAVRWWRGDLEGAEGLLEAGEQPLLQALILAARGQVEAATAIVASQPATPEIALLRAWLDPGDRDRWLAQVAAQFPTPLWPSLSPQLPLLDWLQQPDAIQPKQANRNYLTQGVYRRTDGPRLTDTFTFPVNWVITEVWNGPFQTPRIAVELDGALQAIAPIE